MLVAIVAVVSHVSSSSAENGRQKAGHQNPQAKRMEADGRSCCERPGRRKRRAEAHAGQALQGGKQAARGAAPIRLNPVGFRRPAGGAGL